MKQQLWHLLRGEISQLPIHGPYRIPLEEEVVEIQLEGAFHREADRVLLRFQASFPQEAICDRCLEAVSLIHHFSYEDVIERQDLEDFDFSDLLRQEIILHHPIQTLCRADCAGLCPVCGINRNQESCQCHTQKFDVRFSALTQLLDE